MRNYNLTIKKGIKKIEHCTCKKIQAPSLQN